MSDSKTPVKARDYTAAEVDQCLLELAICAGNSAQAARRLKQQGISISQRHLSRWRTQHDERYVQIANEHARKVEEVVVQQARESALLAGAVEHKALAATANQIDAGTLRDPSSAARNAAVVKGVNIDQVLKLTSRPTVIVENRQADDLIRKLKDLAPNVFADVDGEAIEITQESGV